VGSLAEPVVTRSGMRAQHPANVDGKGCQVIADTYPGGHLRWMLDQAEHNPFPAGFRRYRQTAAVE
jgi:hypothetical protein